MMKPVVIAISAIALVLIGSTQSKAVSFHVVPGRSSQRRRVTASHKTRACDTHGCGHFGASRIGHTHQGLDFETKPGETIYSPIQGYISRYAIPYKNDSRYSGIEIIGTGDDQGKKIKMFYLIPTVLVNTQVKIGDPIGKSQNIAMKFSAGMVNHVHVEYYYNNKLTNPNELFKPE